ncbi:MAG: GTPase HflX [Clostridia bacterium]|nr:GTPase HflX [Clostridia bacterium]
MDFFVNEIRPEKALLIGVDTGEYDAEALIDELEQLAQTAGAEVFAKTIQRRKTIDSATFVGSGFLHEIADTCRTNDIDLIIFDDELTPSQQRNVEMITDVRVIDRTLLILDIFAQRARSREGKIQVELAQLKYTLPRLGGKGTQLSRLGGGIGTRGPGETKLESDRRHIRRRINALEEALSVVEKNRKVLQNRRKKTGVVTVSLVGYTNAGKSSLMNALTNAGVLSENKLFATLDPTSRALTLPDGKEIMLIDTVGLIRKLPHHLVEAFKSTLEEAANADLVLNIVDGSSSEADEHLKVTQNILSELNCSGDKILTVVNKCDVMNDDFIIDNINDAVKISALTGEGIDKLLSVIQKRLQKDRITLALKIPYDKVGLIAKIRSDGKVLSEEYLDDHILVNAIVNVRFKKDLEEYII